MPSHDEPRTTSVSAPTLASLQIVALTFGVVLALFFVLRATATMSVALVLSLMLAVLFSPIMDRAQARGIPAWVASLAVLAMLLLILTGVGGLFYISAAQVAEQWDTYADKANAAHQQLSQLSHEYLNTRLPKRIFFQKKPPVEQIVSQVSWGFGSLVNIGSAGIFVLLFLGFMLNARDMLRAKLLRAIDMSRLGRGDRAAPVLEHVAEQVRVYLYLKAIISAGTGAAFGVVAAVTGLDFPLVWAFVGFVLNFVPSLGPIVASIPAIAVAFFQFDSPVYAFMVSFLMSSVQFISGNVIEPMVLGDRLRLNFIVVLVSISIFGLMWGFAGMVLAVPITAGLATVLRHSDAYRPVAELLSD